MPKISVIIPVYNVKDYLKECLDSLQVQTLDDIEIVAVNDGSTDASREILVTYASKDPRIKIIDKENGGLSSARNCGIKAAVSPIVCFLDSDDMFVPEACERIVQAFVDKGDSMPDIVTFGGMCLPPEASYPWLEEHLSPRDIDYDSFDGDLVFKEMSRPFAWRTACRTEFLIENDLMFDEDLRFGEDQVFHFAIYPRAAKTRLISDKLYIYRVGRPGSLMDQVIHNPSKKVEEHIKICAPILKDWNQLGLSDIYGKELMQWVAEFVLFDALSLPDEERGKAVAELRGFFSTIWSIDDVKKLDMADPTKQMILAVLSGASISENDAKRMRTQYRFGRAGIKGILRSLASKLR